jgi:hypothetical protein
MLIRGVDRQYTSRGGNCRGVRFLPQDSEAGVDIDVY